MDSRVQEEGLGEVLARTEARADELVWGVRSYAEGGPLPAETAKVFMTDYEALLDLLETRGLEQEKLDDRHRLTLAGVRRGQGQIAYAAALADGLLREEADLFVDADQHVRDRVNVDEAARRFRRSGALMVRIAERSTLRPLLLEAVDAYCLGLHGAVTVLCRAALEVVLRSRVGHLRPADKSELDLFALIKLAKRQHILETARPAADGSTKSGADGVGTAHRIRMAGNDWAHGNQKILGDPAAVAGIFWDTVELLERLQAREEPEVEGRLR